MNQAIHEQFVLKFGILKKKPVVLLGHLRSKNIEDRLLKGIDYVKIISILKIKTIYVNIIPTFYII